MRVRVRQGLVGRVGRRVFNVDLHAAFFLIHQRTSFRIEDVIFYHHMVLDL